MISNNLLKEAVVISLFIVVIGVVLHHLTVQFWRPHDLNNMTMYAVHLAGTAFVAHILLELSGLNRWYCKHGNACKL